MKVSDASGNVKMTKVGDELDRNKLDRNDAFILDTGTEVFVWIGSGLYGSFFK